MELSDAYAALTHTARQRLWKVRPLHTPARRCRGSGAARWQRDGRYRSGAKLAIHGRSIVRLCEAACSQKTRMAVPRSSARDPACPGATIGCRIFRLCFGVDTPAFVGWARLYREVRQAGGYRRADSLQHHSRVSPLCSKHTFMAWRLVTSYSMEHCSDRPNCSGNLLPFGSRAALHRPEACHGQPVQNFWHSCNARRYSTAFAAP